MKFSVNRELLLKPLQQVAGVVERRQTLPVLSNLLLQVSGNQLSMTGTDLEVEMIGRLEVVSPEDGEITVPVMEMAALNDNTVWTWNAIGKRKGTWGLQDDAPEATKGFLLNHLIHELLPPKGDGLRWANSDPITGQAAWFDLKVKLEKAAAPDDLDQSKPEIPPLKSPIETGPKELKWKVGK